MKSSFSLKPPLKPTSKSLMITTRRLIEKITLLTENQKETNETLKLILAEMKIDKNNI